MDIRDLDIEISNFMFSVGIRQSIFMEDFHRLHITIPNRLSDSLRDNSTPASLIV